MRVCPSCGEENPERFRVCGICAALLTAAPPREETRKTVTVVFCDLQGSTALGERIDAEALRAVIGRYFDEMKRVIERHGGLVEKFIGDAVMSIFGLPAVHEDDALRAVRAAIEMQAALDGLNRDLNSRWGVTLASRIGIHTGEVVAGDQSTGQRLVTGDAVNVAARLEQAAPPMGILIGEPTYRLLRDAVRVEALAPLVLKGKAEPVLAYRLLDLTGADAVTRHLDAPMVGREAELAILLELFAQTREEASVRLATVIGPAGAGKSRLIAELLVRTSDAARLLHGRCLPYGEGITFWPIAEIARNAAGIADQDTPNQAVTRLATVVPDEPGVVERVAAAIGLTTELFALEDTFWAIRRFLEALGQDQPLVIHVEDIHWAAPTLLDLLEHLLEVTAPVPILIVCSSREELLEQRPDWCTGRSSAVRLILGPLTEAQSALVADHLIGDGGFPRALLSRITEAAAGNPLFVEQLVSMLVDEGRLRQKDGRWIAGDDGAPLTIPPTIQALLAARIDRLAPEERTVLQHASVIGQVIYRSAVTELTPGTLRERVGDVLPTLIGKQLLLPAGTAFESEESLRFGHMLIRDAAYGGLLKQARADLHERFSDWLERTVGARYLEVEEILGYHLEQAYRYRSELGSLDDHTASIGARGATRLTAAGRRAFARGDMPAAANLLGRAAELLPATDAARLELLPDLAEALLDLGELRRAEEVASEAIEQMGATGNERLATHGHLARLMVRYVTDSQGWSDSVLEEIEHALPVLERAADHGGLARAWRLLGSVHGMACRYAEAEQAVGRAIEYARLAGDRRQEVRNLPAYAMAALYGPMPVGEAIGRCEQILEQAPEDLRTEGIVRCTLAQLHAMAGRFDEARALYRQGRATFQELGGRLLIASTSLDSGRVELLAGDPGAAIAELRPDYEALEAMGERYLRSTIAALLAQAEEAAGRYVEADRYAAICAELAAVDDIEAQALWRGMRARLAAYSGDHDEAERLANEAVTLARQTDGIGMQANALLDLAWVLLDTGRADEGARAAAEALSLYRRKGNVIGAERARDLLHAAGREEGLLLRPAEE